MRTRTTLSASRAVTTPGHYLGDGPLEGCVCPVASVAPDAVAQVGPALTRLDGGRVGVNRVRMKELPVVDSFSDAADWFVGLAAAVPAGGWAENGLGDWTIRDLVGHTGRALSTVSEYATDRVETPELATSLDYYRGMALSGAGADDVNAAVAERGRQAGAELGDDPVGALTIMRDTVVALTRTVSPDSLATSRAGTIRMRDYLPTRTLELVVHGLDLQRPLHVLMLSGSPRHRLVRSAMFSICSPILPSTAGSSSYVNLRWP